MESVGSHGLGSGQLLCDGKLSQHLLYPAVYSSLRVVVAQPDVVCRLPAALATPKDPVLVLYDDLGNHIPRDHHQHAGA